VKLAMIRKIQNRASAVRRFPHHARAKITLKKTNKIRIKGRFIFKLRFILIAYPSRISGLSTMGSIHIHSDPMYNLFFE